MTLNTSLAAATLALALASGAVAAENLPKPAPIVFFDIAGPGLKGQADFYRAVFGWDAGPTGALAVPVASPLPGTLRVEDLGQGPVTERVIYIGVQDITAALKQIAAHGGSVVFPRLEVAGVAIVALFKDPAGNRMGLVEMDGARAKVPKAP